MELSDKSEETHASEKCRSRVRKRTERAHRLWNVEDRGIGVDRDIDDAAKRVVARQRSLTVLVSIITGTPCGELIFSFTGHSSSVRGELSPLILLEGDSRI
ncbi:hypothetical protein K0M31_000760 [Melipona bicolor]|uniref:Uncharacterized protein n=1 Tax=Melipona bicolor TaxID=60889 RepID=A0AA40GFD6_9HYME|nr:hypothetical protein K0M31_000760 [Melipona bicolor]